MCLFQDLRSLKLFDVNYLTNSYISWQENVPILGQRALRSCDSSFERIRDFRFEEFLNSYLSSNFENPWILKYTDLKNSFVSSNTKSSRNHTVYRNFFDVVTFLLFSDVEMISSLRLWNKFINLRVCLWSNSDQIDLSPRFCRSIFFNSYNIEVLQTMREKMFIWRNKWHTNFSSSYFRICNISKTRF